MPSNYDDLARFEAVLRNKEPVIGTTQKGQGWGITGGYEPEALTSGMALQALAKSGVEAGDVTKMLQYMVLTLQAPDGSFAINGNDPGLVVTAEAALGLAGYLKVPAVNDSYDLSAAYLIGLQNTNGSFGPYDDAYVLDTALCLRAVMAGGGYQDEVDLGIDWLTAQQLADGSWDDDVYTTAEALLALAAYRANLTVNYTDVSVSPASPVDGNPAAVSAKVRNKGYDASGPFRAALYLVADDGSRTEVGSEDVADLAAGDSLWVKGIRPSLETLT